MLRYARTLLVTLLALLLLPLSGGVQPLGAQVAAADRVENALINGAIGSVSAAVGAAIAGRNPWRALLPGFAGGVAMSAGKQVAGLGVPGSGLVGRQISAAGISVIHSAARDTLLLVMPVGPVTLTLRPQAYDGVHPRLNLAEAAALLYYLIDDQARWNPLATLSSGAPAFRKPTVSFPTSEGQAYGKMVLGTIVLGAYDPHLFPHTQADVVLAHEAIHVLQLDYLNQVISLPIERAVLRRVFPDAGVLRYLDLGLLGPAVAMAFHLQVEYSQRPWEIEAVLLTEGRRTHSHTRSPPSWR